MSGLEIGLWDIKGKALNTPVYQLLAGALMTNQGICQSLAVHTPAEAAKAAEFAAKQDYRAQITSGRCRNPGAVRKAVGDKFDVMVDLTANCRWDPATAVRKGLEFAQYNPYWYGTGGIPA